VLHGNSGCQPRLVVYRVLVLKIAEHLENVPSGCCELVASVAGCVRVEAGHEAMVGELADGTACTVERDLHPFAEICWCQWVVRIIEECYDLSAVFRHLDAGDLLPKVISKFRHIHGWSSSVNVRGISSAKQV
jgi:hypothetical protein